MRATLVTAVKHATAAMTTDVQLLTEVERLRALLERQPSCLMRIGIGGTLLAVNEAALHFLGARTLADVLGTSVVERMDAEEGATIWADFVKRVANAGSASVEGEMTDLAGLRRAVIMQAATLPTHPDGDDSFLVTVRDVSTSRRLQASLQEQEELRRSAQETLHDATANIQELRSRLAELTVERDRLRAASDATADERQQLLSALKQLKDALNTAIDATLLAQQVIEKGGKK